MGDYIADRTTTTSRFEEVLESEFPTITICFDPPQKPLVAEMYGFNSVVEINMKYVTNATLLEVFEASSYILNKDFTTKVDFYGKIVHLKIGINDNFIVKPIITWFFGVCYKIEPKFKVTQFTRVSFTLDLNKSNNDQPSA